MATKAITDESFDSDVIKSNKPTVVDFWAEWCGPCKMIGPILEELSDEMSDKVTIAKHNIDEEPNTPKEQRFAFDWTQAELTSSKESWNHTFYAQEWVDGDEITLEVKARDSTGAWSDTEEVEVMLGSQVISIGNPSGQSPVDGMTTISGTFLTPNPISVEWRIDR